MALARRYYKEIRYEHFRALCAVALHGTYAAAATALGLSRSTVWQQLETLERELAVKLIRRRGRGMELTGEGRLLQELVESPIAALDSVREIFLARLGQAAPVLRLAAIPGTELMSAILQLRQQSPKVQLIVVERLSKEITPLIEDGSCELGFALTVPSSPWSAALHVERIDERPIAVVMPVKHPLARKRTIGLDDLVRYPLITWQRDNPFRHWLEANLERAGVLERMQVVVETSYLETMEQCVSLGLGLGVGTFPHGRRPTVRVCLGVLAAMPSLPLVLLWKKGRLLTPPAALFVELVKQSLKRRRGKA